MPNVQLTMEQLANIGLRYLEANNGAATGTKDTVSSSNLNLIHGPGGMMSRYGLSKDVFNAMILPQLGLLARLPVLPSIEINPLAGILTGQKPIQGTPPATNCAPCQVAGDLKMGAISANFGRTCISTPTVDLSGDIGAIRNRGEFRDFRLVGGPQTMDMGAAQMSPPGSMADFLNREMDANLFKLYNAWARDIYARLVYSGNPANAVNTFLPFRGLDILINTGYQDAETGAWLRAADALVQSFGGTNIASNGVALVDAVTRIMRYLWHNASRTGLNPVKWVITMPEMMFYEVTKAWPCSYQTYRCLANANGATVNLDAVQMRNEVQSMRDGMYLLIDHKKVEVVIDDAITETVVGGNYTASMYFVPLTVQGAIPATYIEYFNFDNVDNREARSIMTTPGAIVSSDGGRFLWDRRAEGYCVSMDATERSRLRLETPWLSARLTNIQYTPDIQLRSGFTDAGDRFYNGGASNFPASYLYTPVVYNS